MHNRSSIAMLTPTTTWVSEVYKSYMLQRGKKRKKDQARCTQLGKMLCIHTPYSKCRFLCRPMAAIWRISSGISGAVSLLATIMNTYCMISIHRCSISQKWNGPMAATAADGWMILACHDFCSDILDLSIAAVPEKITRYG